MTEYIDDVERVVRSKLLLGLLEGKPLAELVCEADWRLRHDAAYAALAAACNLAASNAKASA